jgi:hypothetical protein
VDSNNFDAEFSEQASMAVHLAHKEARRMRQRMLGTEHLLLGLLEEPDGSGLSTLRNLGVDLARLRADVLTLAPRAMHAVPGDLEMAPGTQRVIELAKEEARRMRQQKVGPEHLLLGLVREKEGIAAQALANQGVTLTKTRAVIDYEIAARSGGRASWAGTPLRASGSELLGGRYQVPLTSGQGGITTSSSGWDAQLDRLVTIQVLRDVGRADPTLVVRLQQEVTAATSLHHPNLVVVYDGIVHQGDFYLVRDPFGGMDLCRYLLREQRAGRGEQQVYEQATRIVRDVALGLSAAHTRGTVHGAISPQQILVRHENGSVKLNGLGFAYLFKKISSILRSQITPVTSAIGPYDAPELAREGEVSPASDVYALGMILYELFTGRYPLNQRNSASLPADLQAVLSRALESDPVRRYPDAQAFAQALSSCI